MLHCGTYEMRPKNYAQYFKERKYLKASPCVTGYSGLKTVSIKTVIAINRLSLLFTFPHAYKTMLLPKQCIALCQKFAHNSIKRYV
jgi:hypothetical protein